MNTKVATFINLSLALILTTGLIFMQGRMHFANNASTLSFTVNNEMVVEKSQATIKPQSIAQTEAPVKTIAETSLSPSVATPLPIIPPRISQQVLPIYPVTALAQGVEGVVLLSVYINGTGLPAQVEVEQSSGVAEMDQSAVAAVRQWVFEPALQGGQILGSYLQVPVRFMVKESI